MSHSKTGRKSWKDDITIDDMPNNDMKMIAEQCGIETAIDLIDKFGGLAFYIPREISSFRKAMVRYAKKNFDGRNLRELALELGVAQKTVERMLRQEFEKGELRDKRQIKILLED